jgi:nitronate monooxygenase
MSISTRLTQLLGIKHPILLAPMDIVSDGRLAAAVTRAGGFGMIGGGYGDENWLAKEMDSARDTRVGVGFITWSLAKRPRLLDMALERRPPAVMLSFGGVRPHAEKIKSTGALLICQVQTLEQAKDAAANDADILVAQALRPEVTVSLAVLLRSCPPLSTQRPIFQLLPQAVLPMVAGLPLPSC